MATPPQGPGAPLPAGTRAPDFQLSSKHVHTVAIADVLGRRGWDRALELRLAGGREPRCGRHPASARTARRRERARMSKRAAAAAITLPVGERDHAQGPTEAPVTLVEYGDYECPHCGRAYPIVKQLRQRLGRRLRFVFRNFPLRESHPHAQHAAEAAEAAGAQGKFWEMHDRLFERQFALDDDYLIEYAGDLGSHAAWF